VIDPNQSKTNQSQKIRAKFTAEDIKLATARAERFLLERYPSLKTDNSHEGYSLVVSCLADYDLSMLDEMFSEVAG